MENGGEPGPNRRSLCGAEALSVRSARLLAGSNRGALFASGRSVYVGPESAAPAGREIKTVLVAWNDAREAARALAEAMPFLERAQEVVVAMVDRDSPADVKGAEPGADIARHLDRHGVKVELRLRTGTARPTPSSTRSASLTRTLSCSAPTAIPASANGLSAASRGVS